MEKTIRFLGIIAIVALIGFSMVGCDLDGDNDNGSRHSLDGIWELENGKQVTFSGNSAIINSFGTTSPITADAINKGYISLLSQDWRNVTSTSSLTWSGEVRTITGNPPTATGTSWTNATFTMSANGQTVTITGTTTGQGAFTETWTRSNLSLNGVWELDNGKRVIFSGNNATVDSFGTTSPITADAINKGFISLGSIDWRSVTSTGSLTWSGEVRIITGNPPTATGTGWTNATFTMSPNGQIVIITGTTTGQGAFTETWTRRR